MAEEECIGHFLTNISREVVKKRGLCNINVWRRKSGNSMEGFFSHLSCISRIFRPECSFDRQEAMNPCIQASDFSPPCPGAQGRGNEFCRFVKKLHNQSKTRITILCSMSPHSRTTSSRRLQDFPVCSALAPDSERPAILSGTDLYPCFCTAHSRKSRERMIIISSQLFFSTFLIPSKIVNMTGHYPPNAHLHR